MALVRVQSNPVTISQSTMIVGAILAFFILWLAANGKLATYWNFLIGKGGSGQGTTSGSSSSGGGTGADTTVSPSSAVTDWLTKYLGPNFGNLFGPSVLPGMSGK